MKVPNNFSKYVDYYRNYEYNAPFWSNGLSTVLGYFLGVLGTIPRLSKKYVPNFS